MTFSRRRANGSLTALSMLAALFAAQAATAAQVQVQFRLEITAHETESGTETYSVPLPGVLTLEFDPTWVSTEGPGDAAGIVEVHMAGGSRFTSSITPQMPWAPPGSVPGTVSQSAAVLTNVASERYSYMSFFDYHYASDAANEYHYLISLDSNAEGNDNPFIENIQDYRTPELLAYLQNLMANDEPLMLSEWAFIYDMTTQTYAAWDDYEARAYITAITGDGVSEPPDTSGEPRQIPFAGTPFVMLLGGLLAGFGLARTSDRKR